MRFLRMLTNSLLAGAFGAAYLTIIVLQLNPAVPLAAATPWWWFASLGMLYGVHFAVVFYVAIVTREFFALTVLSPGWISVRLLAWLGAALCAAAATLMWLNVHGLRAALGEEAARRMTIGAVATTVSAVVMLAIAVAHYSFGRRGSRVGASLFAIAVIGSMALPIAARGVGGDTGRERGGATASDRAPVAAEGARVTLLLLDGASLEQIWPRATDGGLPNFNRVLDGGAVMDLATGRPTQPAPVWASVATGKYPSTSGVRSAVRYYARRDRRGVDLLPDHSLAHALVHWGFVRDAPLTSADWGARPLWQILSDAGLTAGIVRWPLTHPAGGASGFIVSDRLHLVTSAIADFERAASPAEALRTVDALARATTRRDTELFEGGRPEAVAHERDVLYARVAQALRAETDPRLFAVRYEGLDVVGHYYLRLVEADSRQGSDEDRRRARQIVDRYYAFIDEQLGLALRGMVPGDLVLVVSAFGMERLNAAKRALGWVLGDPPFSGSHERAPDGFLIAYGSPVQPGRPARGSIVDITPTLLYFFGLPVGRDMDGYTRADLFTREFSGERTITFIPSYR